MPNSQGRAEPSRSSRNRAERSHASENVSASMSSAVIASLVCPTSHA